MAVLGIYIKGYVLNLSGSINAQHFFEVGTDRVDVKLSCGSNVTFMQKNGIWYLKHSSDPEKVEIERGDEKLGINEKIIFNYEISTAWVHDGHELRMYGSPTMTTDEKQIYETLLKYLLTKGVICLEEMKLDLQMIITRNYNGIKISKK